MSTFSLRHFRTSFRHATRGINQAVRREHNLRVHMVGALIVLILAIALKVTETQFAILTITVSQVICLEIVNTAIEKLLDHLHPQQHSEVGFIKDVLAGAVLVAAIAALFVAIAIFLPHLGR